MLVKRLSGAERADAAVISMVAFHVRAGEEALRKEREDALKSVDDDWGAFDGSGTLAARIIRNVYEAHFDGGIIPVNGIGAVSTLPEYRESGAIRAIFEKLLPAAYDAGDVFSTLYPFRHDFYRKFGYETVTYKSEYRFPPALLRHYRFTGWARPWKAGDPLEPFTALYESFAARLNLALRRNGEMVKEWTSGVNLEKRRFLYLLGEGSEPLAYLAFRDVYRPEAAELRVEDLAFSGRRGFLAILGFLGRFSADYGKVVLPLPTDLDLLPFLSDPYEAEKSFPADHMIRLINAEKMLSLLRKSDGAHFAVRVLDPLIPGNEGTFLVEGESVTRTDREPDLVLPQSVLALLAVGAVSPYEVSLFPGAEIRNGNARWAACFPEKARFLTDHF